MKAKISIIAVALLACIGGGALYKHKSLAEIHTLLTTHKVDSQYHDIATQIASARQKCAFPSSRDLGDWQNFIAHAGGAIIHEGKPYTYSNSKEALLASIHKGYRFIELDLMLDSDGEIFGAHDYAHFYGITNAPKEVIESNAQPSKAYISQAKIYGIFTPLGRDSINEIFRQNPSVFLVTDKLNDFRAIATQLEFGERILVEVFGLNNYYKAHKEGIRYPMLSTKDFKLATELAIPMVATHTSALRDDKSAKLAQEYIANGGCIMVFSSNEKEFMSEHLGLRASKFYTDFWDAESKDCALDDKQKCKTY